MMRPGELTQYKTAMLQNPQEVRKFIELAQAEGVKSYLEIGSRFGGSLWAITHALPKGSRAVSVDMPSGNYAKDWQTCLQHCIDGLKDAGYVAHLVLGDSTSESVISAVREHAPFDLCLIDANHLLPYVTKDWNNYGPMARLVAFHDISWKPRPKAVPIEVPGFWDNLKKNYRHVEFRHEERDNGIGVLWNS